MISLSGLSAVPAGYTAGLDTQAKLAELARRQVAAQAAGRTLAALAGGGQGMPQQDGVSPLLAALRARGAQNVQPTVSPNASAAPDNSFNGRFEGAPAPQPTVPPQMQGIKPGSLSWDSVVRTIAQANPGIAPDALASVVSTLTPLMNADSQERWKALDAARLARLTDARVNSYDASAAAKSGVQAGPAKPLLRASVNDLTSAGENYTNFKRLSDTWKDSYGGKMSWTGQTGGNIENWIARNLGLGDKEAANWWQDYQNQKNIARHALFGSALTAQERDQWEKATISPGMLPDLIRKNLGRQFDAEKRAATKLANVYLTQGHNPAEIEAALGFPLSELGIQADTAAPVKPAPAGGQSPQFGDEGDQVVPGQVLDGFRFKGGEPSDPANWEPVR